jgi:intron-binding protein aquarius
LFLLDAAHGIREDLEDVIRRINPRYEMGGTVFGGWARMGCPVEIATVVEVAEPRFGEREPGKVVVEVRVELKGMQEGMRREWDALRKRDVVFLCELDCGAGHFGEEGFRERFGVRMVRGAEILSVRGEDGKEAEDWGRAQMKGTARRFLVRVQGGKFLEDQRARKDVYAGVNLVVRRKAKENNFGSVGEMRMAGAGSAVPGWLEGVFLGGFSKKR